MTPDPIQILKITIYKTPHTKNTNMYFKHPKLSKQIKQPKIHISKKKKRKIKQY